MTREHLLGAVWSDVAVEEGNLNHVISTIRKALGEQATGQSFIETVPRVGYRFVADVTEIAPAPNGPKAKTAGGCRSRQEIRFCVTRDDVNIAYATTGSGYPLVKS